MVVIFFILGVVLSLALNLLVIIVIAKRGKETNHLDLIMLSLAIADIIRSGIGYPVEIDAINHSKQINKISCKIAGFSTTFLGIVSITHLVGISIERCILINFPWRARDWFANKWIALYIIVPSWCYSFIWALMPLFGWSSYAREQGAKYRCSIDLSSSNKENSSYAYTLLVFCFVIPVLLIIISSALTIKQMGSMRRASVNIGMDAHASGLRRQQEVKHNIMAFALIITFFVAWSPYAACVLVMTIYGKVGETLLTFSVILAKTSTLYNPIIYIIFMRDFRLRCWSLFRTTSGRELPVVAVINMGVVNDEPCDGHSTSATPTHPID